VQRIILGTVIAAFGALNVCVAFAQDMTLTSTEVADGATIKEAQVANVFGCKGGNISPSLSWSGAPSDTKSFAISVYDPDAPTGSGFWHAKVFIPAWAKNANGTVEARRWRSWAATVSPRQCKLFFWRP
jgi:phosphatidylethanolamine-binding protein (PEBP) family uncharacterized protein